MAVQIRPLADPSCEQEAARQREAFPVHPLTHTRLVDLFKAQLERGCTPVHAAGTLGYDRQFADRMMARIAREAEGPGPGGAAA